MELGIGVRAVEVEVAPQELQSAPLPVQGPRPVAGLRADRGSEVTTRSAACWARSPSRISCSTRAVPGQFQCGTSPRRGRAAPSGARRSTRGPARRAARTATGSWPPSRSCSTPGAPGSGVCAAAAIVAFTTRSTGMMSMTPSGIPGNSGRSPRPNARMIGSAILKPSIQPGYGLLECALDDAGAQDRDRQVRRRLLDGALGHRLGERVAVGPAEAAAALAPGVDQRLVDPLATAPLGGGRHRRRAVDAVLVLGLGAERRELLGRAAVDLDPFSEPGCELGLVAPVDGRGRAGLRGCVLAGGRRRTPSRRARSAGALPLASIAASRFSVPWRLVAKPSSIGGSNDTSPAQWMTMSRSSGSAGT